MIVVKFTAKDIEQLSEERLCHPHPHVMKKMWALSLKSKGISNHLICDILDISANTLLSYFKDFNSGGVSKLKNVNFYQPQSKLCDYKDSIENYFKLHPPISLNEAAVKIEELTGLKRSIPQVYKFLKKIGMRFRKTGQIPAKAADPNKKI